VWYIVVVVNEADDIIISKSWRYSDLLPLFSWIFIFIFIFWNELPDLRKWNEYPFLFLDFYFYFYFLERMSRLQSI